MSIPQELEARYSEYVRFSQELVQNASPTAGLLGLGSSPKDDPGHQIFYDDVKSLSAALAATRPDSEEALCAVSLILRAPADHRNAACYWYMYAAQIHAAPLIPFLSSRDCRDLATDFEALYPRRDRMPVQKQILKLLKQHAHSNKNC